MAPENLSTTDEPYPYEVKKYVQKLIKCGSRVGLEGAPVEEEQDKVHHRPPVSDSEESPYTP